MLATSESSSRRFIGGDIVEEPLASGAEGSIITEVGVSVPSAVKGGARERELAALWAAMSGSGRELVGERVREVAW
jgi:hypothetical protein